VQQQTNGDEQMLYLYLLFQLIFTALTAIGSISTVGGDFLNTGISHTAMGFLTLLFTVLTVVSYACAMGSITPDTSGFGFTMFALSYMLSLCLPVFAIIPAIMVFLGMFAGGFDLANILAQLFIPIFFIGIAVMKYDT
jgi:hypothetical protein